MDALSDALQPYKDIVGLVASICTLGQFLAGAVICKEIHNAKSTEGKKATHFIGGIVLGLIMFQYALFLGDSTMLRVNIAGITLNILYLTCFYCYCANKQQDVIKPFVIGMAIVGAVYIYTKIENAEVVQERLGILLTVALMGLISSPLFNAGEIIRKRNAETMPIPIILSGGVMGFMWGLYSIIIKDKFGLFQNCIGLTLTAIQILLYIFFRGGVKEEKKKE